MARSAAALHILVDSQTEAEALLQKLRRGANFQALARRHSRCPSKRQGAISVNFVGGAWCPSLTAPSSAAHC